jgi:condensin complex subunit 2
VSLLSYTLASSANINVSKLDSAFDIDPLFHKMSKTFDEGGAKGLLLVNLGVGANGCNIVFDSKEEAASIAQDEEKEDDSTIPGREEGLIDISSLNTKLESMLGGASIESIPLVPQLRSLREEYGQLESEGFVDHNVPKTKVCLRVRGNVWTFFLMLIPFAAYPP